MSFTLIALTSCKVIFTETMKNKYENAGINVKKIQFYNSEQFELSRKISASEAKTVSGKVQIENGIQKEFILVGPKTQGKCDSIVNNILYVSFDIGKGKSIRFKTEGDNSPYSIDLDSCTVENTGKRFPGMPNGSGGSVHVCSVYYNGKLYQAKYGNVPKLVIKNNQKTNVRVSRQKAKGVKVD